MKDDLIRELMRHADKNNWTAEEFEHDLKELLYFRAYLEDRKRQKEEEAQEQKP